MINTKTLTALAAAAMLFTACEKEGGITPDNSVNSENAIKSGSMNDDKAGSNYWNRVQEFTYKIMNEIELPDMKVQKALDYTEAALDFRLSNTQIDDVQFRKLGDELSFDISYGLNLDMTGESVVALNSQIYNAISTQASNLATATGEQVNVEVVDLEWTINATSTNIAVSVLYGVADINRDRCFLQSTDHREAGVRKMCTNGVNTATIDNAHERIDGVTRRMSCKTWNNVLNCPLGLQVNIRRSDISNQTSCGITFFVGSPNDCRNYNALNTDYDNVRDAWNNGCSSITNRSDRLRTVNYNGDYSSNPGLVEFNVTYYTSECKSRFYGDLALDKPLPVW